MPPPFGKKVCQNIAGKSKDILYKVWYSKHELYCRDEQIKRQYFVLLFLRNENNDNVWNQHCGVLHIQLPLYCVFSAIWS